LDKNKSIILGILIAFLTNPLFSIILSMYSPQTIYQYTIYRIKNYLSL
jgi:hypothetical protein